MGDNTAAAQELPNHHHHPAPAPAPTTGTIRDGGLVAQVRSAHPDATQEWFPQLGCELLILIPEPWSCRLCILIPKL